MPTSMNLFDPWRQMKDLQDEMNKMFNRPVLQTSEESSVCDWTPAVDIKEDQDQYIIHADIPGVNPKDIELHMENGVLTMKGERSSEKKESREGYKRIERAYGSFFRRFSLPDSADAENIKANSKDGVLEIIIPKHEKVQPRRITVGN